MRKITLVNFVPRTNHGKTTPLGPLYLTSVLEQAGCVVDFRDYQIESNQNSLSQKNILNFLSDSHKTLGISCFFNTIPFLLLCLQEIKAQYPEKTVVLGGSGPSSNAGRLMKKFPFIDVVVRGEAENTILDFVKNRCYKNIKGITFREGKNVCVNPPRERIKKLDNLPFPAYHRINLSDYDHVGIITSRGCPYECTFCEVAPLWGHYTTRRSVSNVINEIKILKNQYSVKTLHINDDTFVLNKKWVMDFCKKLKAENLDISWRCLGRINLMDKELLSSMADAGCIGIQYGIESGSQRVLNRIKKKIDLNQVEKVVEMSVNHIDNVISTFMWGFPFETMEDFYETIYLMGQVAEMGSSIKLLFLSPASLTPLYKEYNEQLNFSEELVSNLVWGVLKEKISVDEREKILRIININPEIFPHFFYIHNTDVTKKYHLLKDAGFIYK